MSSNYLTQVMLCEYFNCKMVVKYIYIRMSPYRIYQADLNLSTCIIFMMKNTEFGMSTLLMKIEVTFIILIKIHAPVNKLSDLSRCLSDKFFNNQLITKPAPRIQSVSNTRLKIIPWSCNRCYTPLCIISICFLTLVFCNNSYFTII